MDLIFKITDHPVYILFTLLVIIPIDISFIVGGSIAFGIMLLFMQLPWVIRQLCRLEGYLNDQS